ncbi:MAG TPA: DNA repair protein RecN [Bryobacteraceae bacterium]|nr:DNA repair protein RecN [Bryobacteraceae bacterium]
MLVELMVENLAVIERLRVRFHSGFNVLSGETGSGKSIVVDALGLLLGGRASAEMVRTGCDRARVSGIFDIPAGQLEALGIGVEDGELLVEREILSNGKSRAFVASRPVTVSLLKDLAALLGEIHGQHDQQRLFDREEQLALLDECTTANQEEVARLFEAWRTARAGLEQIDKTGQERLRLADLWAHQVREIESVAPRPGEDDALEQERNVQQNVTRLQQSAAAAFEALYDSPGAALAQMRLAQKRIEELTRIDASLTTLVESLKTAEALVHDTALTLRDYLGGLEADPARLDQIEARLESIQKLKRKYGATIAEVLAFHAGTRNQLDTAENAEGRRAELKAMLDRAGDAFQESARRLSQARREAARKLEKRVEGELASLAMDRTRFTVAFTEAAWSPRGLDGVEFLIAPNLGEEPKPLNRIASGGELSRLALALKASATTAAKPKGGQRTLVFDEVDAGIGGRAAEAVGRRLKQISGANQVLCVTHLAQIAGFADYHYSVQKLESKGRTVATIEELQGEARTLEISRMLSGRMTPEALKHAEQLIKLGSAG